MRLKGLKEQNFGLLEGEHNYLQHLRPYGDLFVKYGGESDSEVQDRIVTTCTELMHRSVARQFWQSPMPMRVYNLSNAGMTSLSSPVSQMGRSLNMTSIKKMTRLNC